MQIIPPEFRAAYEEHERELTILKTKWGCVLGIILVPLFAGLDFFMIDSQPVFWSFLSARLLCSSMMALVYLILRTAFGRKHYRFLGVAILFLPSATIACMIYRIGGSTSPYYAGLILVMMVLAVLLDWTFWQSVASVALVWLLYLAACVFSPAPFALEIFINNAFFLISTGITIIIASWFHSDLRRREFVSRYELAAKKNELEKANREIKEAQMQLVQSEKLASFGLIAAGIMHEINNALTYPMSGVNHLLKRSKLLAPEPQAEQAKVLNTMKKSLGYAKEIISGLQVFAHPNTEQKGPVPVAEVVNQAKLFLSNKWQGKVQIEQRLAENQTIWANQTKLIQVVMNLLNNSLDALETKSFADDAQATIWIEGRVENGQSILSVRDNGPGIAEKDQPSIFDPFFTTKGAAGRGLGLSICAGIVREADGEILMKSVVGKFCEFTLKFPVRESEQAIF